MVTDYQRGYAKGYNTGGRRSDAELAHERATARQAAERAERAEKQSGHGHCEDCANWTKGGDSCMWGYCKAPTGAGTPFVTWIRSDSAIVTSIRFGCVLFKARP